MFVFEETPFAGLRVLRPRVFADARGLFIKTYHHGIFRDAGLDFVPAEEFYSVSGKGVLRGMHFQAPPRDHAKLVYCIAGRVLDVVVDLRKKSPTFTRAFSREMSPADRAILFIPSGFAHGFLALEDDSIMVYQTGTTHSPDQDAGIHWRSIGFAWPVSDPVVSDRDAAFPALAEFDSPF